MGSYEVSGSITFANGRYTDNTQTHGGEQFDLSPACLTVSGVPVECKPLGNLFAALFAPAQCSANAVGGCGCSATIAQSGGLALLSPVAGTSGDYTTAGSTLTLDDSARYRYCVAQDTLTLTPESQFQSQTGQVVLQRTGGVN